MKREQIIEILENMWEILKKEGGFNINDTADAILALPLDVPIGLDCEIWRQKDRQQLIDRELFTRGELDQRLLGRWEGLIWMRDEIIKRNK